MVDEDDSDDDPDKSSKYELSASQLAAVEVKGDMFPRTRIFFTAWMNC